MISTVFNSETVFILNERWDENEKFQLTCGITRDTQAGLTKREARRPYSETLLCTAKFPAISSGDDLRRLQASLKALNTQSVVLPLWPAAVAWADRDAMPISGGLLIVWNEDWSDYDLYEAGSEPIGRSASDLVAPALLGSIDPNELDLLTATVARWEIQFTESSPAAFSLQPSAFSFTGGPTPAGYAAAPKLLPLRPFSEKISETIKVEVERERMGFSREQHQEFYQHAAARSLRAQFTLRSAEEVAQMLYFFQTIGAPGQSFWAQGWFQIGALSMNASAADTVLNLVDTVSISVGDYIALFNGSLIARKVTAKTADTITLDAAPGVALDADEAFIFPLCLVRLDKPTLAINWLQNGIAQCDLQWTEQPTEVLIPADETLGTTIGKLQTRVVLFEFARDLRNGTVLHYYWTNFERDLDWNGQTWTCVKQLAHGDIPQSTNLENDGCDISLINFAGNPLMEDVLRRAEAPLTITIRHADFDGAAVSNAQIVFSGDCDAPKRSGEKITMRCIAGPGLLDSMFPFFIRGRLCGHLRGNDKDGTHLVSAGCTGPDNIMLASAWKFTAKIGAPVSVAHPYLVYLTDLAGVGANAIAALAANAVFVDWFAGGRIEWGAGSAVQRRYIGNSTLPAAGALQVKLHKYFTGVPLIGADVVLYPGCDGQYSTCKAYNSGSNPTGKFGNSANFGGQPFSPIGNPSISGMVKLGVQGGKK